MRLSQGDCHTATHSQDKHIRKTGGFDSSALMRLSKGVAVSVRQSYQDSRISDSTVNMFDNMVKSTSSPKWRIFFGWQTPVHTRGRPGALGVFPILRLPSAEAVYRGTSLIRKCPLLGPYRRPMPMVLRRPGRGGAFLLGEVPL